MRPRVREILLSLAIPLLAAQPFWEAKAPDEWTQEELAKILDNSPWSQSSRGRDGEIRIHLATAKPMQEAERRERASRRMRGANDSSFEEYLAMLREGPGQYIVLAVLVPDRKIFADAVIASKIDSDSRLFAGGKEWKPITHFPPSSTDPYLRVVFPRRVEQKAKSLEFTVYVPGVTDPYRRLLFPVNKMTYRGRVEY